METISIITVSFCSVGTIKDTLESVNVQTYPRIDHIIIDGASNDGTLALVAEHGKRVTYISSEPDKGINDAYNKGLAVAKGEVIGILNSDDYYVSSSVIDKVMRLFKDPAVEAVYADLMYVDKNNLSRVVRHWKSKNYPREGFARGFSPAHPSLFLRKSVYERVGDFNTSYRFAGDYEFMLRAFHIHGIKSVYLPETLVFMRTGGATGGSLPFIRLQNLEIFRALDSHGVKVSKKIFLLNKFFDRLMQRIRALLVRLPKDMM